MIIILGKTASGKDLTVKKLISLHNFSRLITYTSRPMRKGEKQDITYHYISEENFKQKIQDGFFAEWKSYETVDGVWYYGTALEDLENANDKTVIILTPDGYRDILSKLSEKPKSIYIYANNKTIQKRLVERGDNPKEAERRLEHDTIDFKGLENEVDKIFYNNDGTNINDVVDKILEFLGEDK